MGANQVDSTHLILTPIFSFNGYKILSLIDILRDIMSIYYVIYIMEEEKMTKQRIMLISLVGIIVFGLLLGGRIIYQKQWVDASILSQSQHIPGVITTKKVQVNGQSEMDVQTSHLTNLSEVSQSLRKLAGNLPIRYLDQRNNTLSELFDQMEFPLQEGIAQGDFTEMAQNVKKLAEKAGVQLELQMDNDAIYVVLNQGKAQLVEVLERHQQGQFLPSEKFN